jgi:heme/copper-type cytochrome/quinol oxidase subunit 2
MQKMSGQPTEAALAEMKQQIAMEAMLEGINYTFFISAIIIGAALVLAFFIKRAKPAEDKLDETSSSKQIVNRLAKT